MESLLNVLITVFGWGTWLTPSQKVIFPSQEIKTLYVVLTNLGIATVVAVWRGAIVELAPATFWLTVLGGMIWAVGGLCAFTGTNKLGIAKAFGIWAPLNIIVSLTWGAALFHEFINISLGSIVLLVAAILTILVGILLIIFAKDTDEGGQERGAFRLGFGATSTL